MNIMRLEVKDFGVIRFVRVTPEGNVVTLTGEAGSGKTTLLTALRTVFGGEGNAPSVPIRRGANKAEIVVVLGQDGETLYTCKQTFSGKTPSFKVLDKDGKPVPSPRTFLAGLVGSQLALDPTRFLAMDAKEQGAALLKAAGVDLAPLDAKAKKLYDERTDVNRRVSRARAQVQGMTRPAVPEGEEEVNLEEVLAKQQALLKEKAANEEVRRAASDARKGVDAAQRRADDAVKAVTLAEARVAEVKSDAEAAIKSAEAEVARLEAEVVAAQKRVVATAEDGEKKLKSAIAAVESSEATVRERAENVRQAEAVARLAEEKAKSLVDPDLAAVESELAGLEKRNRDVRAAKAYAEKAAELKKEEAESERLTLALDAVEEEKKRLLSSVDLGVEGLGVENGAVTLNGFPLAQASRTEQLLAAVAVGLQGKELKLVLLEEAAYLSPKGLAAIADFADKRGAHVWLERPLRGEETPGVTLVDGTLEAEEAGAEAGE